jgi:hypothetical protein
MLRALVIASVFGLASAECQGEHSSKVTCEDPSFEHQMTKKGCSWTFQKPCLECCPPNPPSPPPTPHGCQGLVDVPEDPDSVPYSHVCGHCEHYTARGFIANFLEGVKPLYGDLEHMKAQGMTTQDDVGDVAHCACRSTRSAKEVISSAAVRCTLNTAKSREYRDLFLKHMPGGIIADVPDEKQARVPIIGMGAVVGVVAAAVLLKFAASKNKDDQASHMLV